MINLLSMLYPKLALLRKRLPLSYIGVFILFSLPLNTALAMTVFTTGFESGDLSESANGFWWRIGKNSTVSTENAKNGSYSLRLAYPGVPDGKDSWAEQPFALGSNYPDVWVKYDLYIPGNYYHRVQSGSANNKAFLYLWVDDYNKPTGPMYGPNIWPSASLNDGRSKLTPWAMVYQNGSKILDKHYSSESTTAITTADRGKWMTVTLHYKQATSANNDGVMEIWIDRGGSVVKITDMHDGPWYASDQAGFNEGYLLGWANSGFDKETVFYIDNFEVSTTPFTASVGGTGVIAPPNPPSLQ